MITFVNNFGIVLFFATALAGITFAVIIIIGITLVIKDWINNKKSDEIKRGN
jgi:hypothetical protein